VRSFGEDMEAADAFMIESEKVEEASIGRTLNRFVVVLPGEDVKRETTSEVLDSLMSKRAEDDLLGGKKPGEAEVEEPSKGG
jgi:hypothetical protein